MKKLIAACMLLSGCAHVSFTDKRTDDVECGKIANVTVVNRHWSGISCNDAMGWTSETYLGRPLFGQWTVYFTGAYAGFDVNRDLQAYNPDGVTYPADRAIVVRSMRPWVLEHEFLHAWDIDNGLPNTRD